MKNIILASQSPRRKELLAQVGFTFEIITSDVEEKITHTRPSDIAESLSCQKAEDVFSKVIDKYGTDEAKDYLVIGPELQGVCVCAHSFREMIKVCNTLVLQLFYHLIEYGGKHDSVVRCSVMIEFAKIKVVAKDIELVLFQLGVNVAGH